ncbi:MAG: dethiobiotin synthase [Desulfobacterales bacterium]|jgi:dethiobiotin synthase|nr:dethiobiotin synthase [Desulfobacterales bacterium]
MAGNFPDTIFVAGTDTAVGKTVVSALLVAGLRAEYWKPVQSGAEAGTDTEWIRSKTGLPNTFFHPEVYVLSPFLSPHAAASREGVRIDLAAIQLPERRLANHLIIEGAGGIMVPLNEKETMADLIHQLRAPVLLVARSTLGTINHTLLSLEKLRSIKANILGVVMNGPINPDNRAAIESFGHIRVITEIPPMAVITGKSLLDTFNRCFDLKRAAAARQGDEWI